MKRFTPVLLAILMTGCASASYTKLTDGQANLDCSGILHNWGSCEKQAAELCPDTGYKILSTTSKKANPDAGWSERIMSEYNAPRSMRVACKSGHWE